ncbi:Rossmann fold nucleotide-binding protein [Nocardioides sp. 616]|uniref:LOG family protein n=1 Tax=Nocardioides sp. 616 TaxID=2268090 RepID=UPI000CE37DE5|nr:Rossmann fold nucleotide-binding protein [Nocardioides sp. 616]
MRHTRGRVVEVDTVAELEWRLAAGARSLSGWRLRGLDLTPYGAALSACDVAGALFLGCVLSASTEQSLRARGAIVFPAVPGSPVDSYRSHLYSARELYDTPDYQDSLDARAYAWSRGADPDLAQALHDHAIDAALADWVQGRRLVGVMGGHAVLRGEPEYAAAARLGHALGGSYVVATGGGPGAMEAANLGGYLAGQPSETLDEAVAVLSATPSFRPDTDAWVRAAFEVLERHPAGADTLGIPTWHYGHEPPNAFGTAIAKYFRNATREAILLEICSAGIVFLPGAAGTVQEVFQDGCENYYADESSTAPMVLVGRRHWTQTVPAWPLLQALARGRAMEPHVHLVEDVEEAAALVLSHR